MILTLLVSNFIRKCDSVELACPERETWALRCQRHVQCWAADKSSPDALL